MTPALLPRLTRLLSLAVGVFVLANFIGCGQAPKQLSPDPTGPQIDAGPLFPLSISRVEARVYTFRAGQSVPPQVLQRLREQSETLPEPLNTNLRNKGLLGAFLRPAAAADLERELVGTVAAVDPSRITGSQQPALQPRPLGDVAVVPIRPTSTWSVLLDAPARMDPWAMALDSTATAIKPGTLRWYVRTWPAPGEPIPTAGMAAVMQVQLLPVLTGPMHEPPTDPLAPPRLSNDLHARGQVLGRQSMTIPLHDGQVLALVALPRAASTLPGPEVEAAPMLGQVLLGPGPSTTAPGQPSGPKVMVLKAIVPGTYRLLLE